MFETPVRRRARDAGAARSAERTPQSGRRGQWWRFTLLLIFTAVVLVPVAAVFFLSLQPPMLTDPGASSTGRSVGLASFYYVLTQTGTLQWLGNSLLVSVVTVVVSVVVAAPAGYVISRGRHRLVGAYALLLFVIQSLPGIVAIIPLFILFASLGLVDSLPGVVIIYVGGSLAVATWMMAAYFDSIPFSLEEAAWMDGCSLPKAFVQIVLRNSLPGLLSTAIFSFLVSWNDYLVAVIFLRSSQHFTLPVGLQTFFQQNATDWGPVMAVSVIMLLPPIIVFAFLNRYFSIGGIGGALAGQ
jgi:multiple sugar transport system permease protein